MGSLSNSWENKEGQLPRGENTCRKSITATSRTLDTRSDTRVEALTEEVDTKILKKIGKIREGEKNTDGGMLHLPKKKNRTNIPKIHTIIGGFTGGGESNRARTAYARQAGSSHEVYVIGRPPK